MLIGAIVVSTFAVIWIAAGTRNLGRRWFSCLLSISILISLGVIVAAGKIAPAHRATFNGKAYGLSVAFETVLIFLAVFFLRSGDRKRFLLPLSRSSWACISSGWFGRSGRMNTGLLAARCACGQS
jgi:hypothetical protein